MAHRFDCYEQWKGEMAVKRNGSLIAMESGTATAYSLDKLQYRGRFFIFPGEEVYMGQVIGENTRQNDITVNITKTKKLTNMRASGSDDKAILAPPVRFSLEEAMEYIARMNILRSPQNRCASERSCSMKLTVKELKILNRI